MHYTLLLENKISIPCNIYNYKKARSGILNFVVSNYGYQEIISDPSWTGDFVVFTGPHIGTTGFSEFDNESKIPTINAIITRVPIYDYYAGDQNSSFIDKLIEEDVLIIDSLDTRALCLYIQKNAKQRVIAISNKDLEDLKSKSQECIDEIFNSINNQKLFNKSSHNQNITKYQNQNLSKNQDSQNKRVLIIDFGLKYNSERILNSLNVSCDIVFYEDFKMDKFKDYDGYLLSSGPGNPFELDLSEYKKLLQYNKPVMGICLGHQIIGIIAGYELYTMKFGQHSANHPVVCSKTSQLFITSQNHNFAIKYDPNVNENIIQTHYSIMDNTNQGIEFKNKPIFSVQYHPEGSPGPVNMEDFKKFINYIYA